MCMKYVNTNTMLFKTVKKDGDNVIGLLEPFDFLISEPDSKIISIEDFNIVTYFTIMGSRQEENSIFNKDKLIIKVRFTKCTPNKNESLSIDLDDYEIQLKDSKDIVYDSCVPFLRHKRITRINSIELDVENPKGSYVFKVLVKFPNDEKYTVQSMYRLKVE